MRLFVAGLRKLVRRPATYVTFGLLVGLLALIYIAVGATARQAAAAGGDGAQALLLVTFPRAYTLLLSFILGLGGLFAMIYGAAVAGSEWTWGTLKSAVARGESRSRYQLLSFASIGPHGRDRPRWSRSRSACRGGRRRQARPGPRDRRH